MVFLRQGFLKKTKEVMFDLFVLALALFSILLHAHNFLCHFHLCSSSGTA